MGDVFLYENLADPSLMMGRMTLEQVQARLTEKLTAWPEGLLNNLRRDQLVNEGNLIVPYQEIGRARE